MPNWKLAIASVTASKLWQNVIFDCASWRVADFAITVNTALRACGSAAFNMLIDFIRNDQVAIDFTIFIRPLFFGVSDAAEIADAGVSHGNRSRPATAKKKLRNNEENCADDYYHENCRAPKAFAFLAGRFVHRYF
jgi:hypothetical protein